MKNKSTPITIIDIKQIFDAVSEKKQLDEEIQQFINERLDLEKNDELWSLE